MKQEIKKLSSIILMLCAVVLCTCCQDEDLSSLPYGDVQCKKMIGLVHHHKVFNKMIFDIEPYSKGESDEEYPFGYYGGEVGILLTPKNKAEELALLDGQFIEFSGRAKLYKCDDLSCGGNKYYNLWIDNYRVLKPENLSRSTEETLFACGTNENVTPPEWFFSEDADN